MHNNLEVMKVALRVLTAVSHKHAPNPHDVTELEEIAGPKPHGMGTDEFTCGVIQDALKKRAQARHRIRVA